MLKVRGVFGWPRPDNDHPQGEAPAGHHHAQEPQAKSCCGGKHGDADKTAGTAVAIDPVCGMSVNPEAAKHRFAYKGQDYFFCSAPCPERFEAEPEKFLPPQHPDAAAPAATIHTCPL